MRKLKLTLLRLFHEESLAHMRARWLRNKKLDMDRARVENWLYQGENRIY